MATVTIFLLLAGSLAFADAAEGTFSYSAQNLWTGMCNSGNQMRQSPIDIQIAENNSSLVALQMTGWDTALSGVLENNGATAQFTPSSTPATFVNHLGTYQLLQFHMHWGSRTGEGSEHTINGEQAELEIHFVTRQSDDNLAVLGILADVDSSAESVTGFWSMLDINAISYFDSNTTVTNFRINQLLPSNLSYWFYRGSLTTPPCTEVVNWFVLKNRITVPGAFLGQLRELETSVDDSLLTSNYRMTQEIGAREVYQYPSVSAAQSISAASFTLSIVLAVALFMVKLF